VGGWGNRRIHLLEGRGQFYQCKVVYKLPFRSGNGKIEANERHSDDKWTILSLQDRSEGQRF
jgi:hypothetical protein